MLLLSRKSESEKATAHGVIPALSPSGKGQTLGTVEQRFGVAVRRKGRAERTFQALAESVWYINGMQCAVTHLSKPAEQTGPSRQLQIWVRVTCRCHQCPLRGGCDSGGGCACVGSLCISPRFCCDSKIALMIKSTYKGKKSSMYVVFARTISF